MAILIACTSLITNRNFFFWYHYTINKIVTSKKRYRVSVSVSGIDDTQNKVSSIDDTQNIVSVSVILISSHLNIYYPTRLMLLYIAGSSAFDIRLFAWHDKLHYTWTLNCHHGGERRHWPTPVLCADSRSGFSFSISCQFFLQVWGQMTALLLESLLWACI